MELNLITSPVAEPITLSDVEAAVRLPGQLSGEAEFVESLITAVREQAESITRRALVTQTWELVLDSFPSGREPIVLPKPPLQSIVSIKYTDVDSVEQTFYDENNTLSCKIVAPVGPSCGYGYVMPLYGLTWPVALSDLAVVKIQFTCGYGPIGEDTALNVPNGILQWIKINVANLFENRESVVITNGRETLIDMTSTLADGLIANYRLYRL